MVVRVVGIIKRNNPTEKVAKRYQQAFYERMAARHSVYEERYHFINNEGIVSRDTIGH